MKTKRDEYETSPVVAFGELVFNLLMLNVLWTLCSIFIITIGCSCTALNYTCIKMCRDEGDSIIRMFFRSFRDNFRQALVLGTGMLIIFILLLAGLIQALGVAAAGNFLGVICIVLLVFVFLIWLVMYTYIFMILARFDNPSIRTVTNAAYMVVKEMPLTLKVLVIEVTLLICLPVVLWNMAPFLFPMYIFFGMATITYINAKEFNKVFEKYM